MKRISVLIPTYNRPCALAVTLTGLCFQSCRDFDVTISDQSGSARNDASLDTVARLLEKNGHSIRRIRNAPPRGMAQQRQFLLEHSAGPYSLFLDDDLVLEPYVLENLVTTLERERCGFAGCAPIGLSYRHEVRPHEQHVELWAGRVAPERVEPGDGKWNRHKLHNAANLYHVQEKLGATPASPVKYKVAWIGGCVMYNTARLREAGGFGFWRQLPARHCGEDVLAQLRVARRFGGCGLMPSGVYHQELPTTVPDRRINAPEYLSI